ncbi:hypothetical protein [Nitrososphaera viennensis]|uniref:Uncharacterized protein n=2 Tax=Nitrososphaera viennensis TaxID=1034015 RepID=A0A060HIG3_9ARCH|nr:hypothetical protein [Nitrososphaera viennensis]AIC15100.1 hypothetical protein NVIE_008770 [Nitrososphaera viennensis EN76]UVS70024.1 hypothetical protein NWT39_04365 [Nitrososphaera viennensis]
MAHPSSEKEGTAEIYYKLKALGVNVRAVRNMNLSLHQLEDFHYRLHAL